MVTARKKNGKPRRTVDMQVLNKHAVRETHHTQCPFHQATLVPSKTKKTITDACNGITVCQSEKKIATSPRSSCHGVGTDKKIVHMATLLHRTGTPEDSTRLSMTSPTKPNASMTHAYGQTLSKRASLKHVAG